jgi:hypothetical protein
LPPILAGRGLVPGAMRPGFDLQKGDGREQRPREPPELQRGLRHFESAVPPAVLPFIGTRWRIPHILLHCAGRSRSGAQGDKEMSATREERTYQESRIEDEPILGAVLVLPSGRIQPLTFWERVLARLHLTSAKALEARYLEPANS